MSNDKASDLAKAFSGKEELFITEAAIAHIKKMLVKEAGMAFRLGLKNSGCSGKSYTMDIIKEIASDDIVFSFKEGIKVVIEKKNAELLSGLTIDYVREGLNSQFKISNPQQKASCGCGESFNF